MLYNEKRNKILCNMAHRHHHRNNFSWKKYPCKYASMQAEVFVCENIQTSKQNAFADALEFFSLFVIKYLSLLYFLRPHLFLSNEKYFFFLCIVPSCWFNVCTHWKLAMNACVALFLPEGVFYAILRRVL